LERAIVVRVIILLIVSSILRPHARAGWLAIGGKIDSLRAVNGNIGVMHNAVFVDPFIGVVGPGRHGGQESGEDENRSCVHAASIAVPRDLGLVTGRHNVARCTSRRIQRL
jgi:hypothetical protein